MKICSFISVYLIFEKAYFLQFVSTKLPRNPFLLYQNKMLFILSPAALVIQVISVKIRKILTIDC